MTFTICISFLVRCLFRSCCSRSRWEEPCLLRTPWGFSFGTLWGPVHADRSLVSSGPAGRWRCWGKRWGKWAEGSCTWLTAEGVCLQRSQEGKGLMWKTGFLAPFVCGVDRVQCCSLACGVRFSQHRLLRGLSFPWCMFLAPFLWINWSHTCRLIPGLSALFFPLLV